MDRGAREPRYEVKKGVFRIVCQKVSNAVLFTIILDKPV
jgi:hypothetical protein